MLAAAVTLSGLIASCGGTAGGHSSASSPATYGFRFVKATSSSVITVDGPVRCFQAARGLYVSSPDSYPTASTARTIIVSIIVAGFHGDGTYKVTESSDDPNSVIVWVLDYQSSNNYSVLATGRSGQVRVTTKGQRLTGHLDGTMSGSADSMNGDWACGLTPAPPSLPVTVTPVPVTATAASPRGTP